MSDFANVGLERAEVYLVSESKSWLPLARSYVEVVFVMGDGRRWTLKTNKSWTRKQKHPRTMIKQFHAPSEFFETVADLPKIPSDAKWN